MSNIEISQRLASSRRELLDIGLKNSMINFRGGSKSLTIVGESSTQVFNVLVEKESAMTFGYLEGKAGVNAISEKSLPDDDSPDAATLALLGSLDQFLDQPAGKGVSKPINQTDKTLETNLTEDRLFLNLLRIQNEAETYIQEQGVNVLFLTLGFLNWYEDTSSEKVRKAPLILIPVELKRSESRDSFQVSYTGDELVQNLSLQAKLKTDFGIELPLYEYEGKSETESGPSLNEYFELVSKHIAKNERWKVNQNEISLGFFSFGKFLMFKDLDPGGWPEGKQPNDHPVIKKLFSANGFSSETAAVSANAHLDDVFQPGEIHFVRDADSTQTLAILEAREGRNLIIQGPPGTGKSQTITNIIAELLGNKKTVLFVAEKMAALDVVKRRLDENHLGDAVLELHSQKATKQSVLRELARTLEQGKPIFPDTNSDTIALRSATKELNDYCKAVNFPSQRNGISFINALGNVLKIRRQFPDLTSWPIDIMKDWSQVEFLNAKEKVTELALHISKVGAPTSNPYWGCKVLNFSPVEHTRLQKQLMICSNLLKKISLDSSQIASRLGMPKTLTIRDIEVVCRAAKRAAEAPKLNGIRLNANDWQLRRDAIRALIKAGNQMTTLKSEFQNVFIEQAWEQDLLSTRRELAATGDKWWRILAKTYRTEKARLRGLSKGELPKSNKECLSLIDSVLAYQEQKKSYDQHSPLGEALFGAQWLGTKSDWEVLARIGDWIFALYDDLGRGEVPAGLINFLSGHPNAGGLNESANQVKAAISLFKDSFANALELIQANTVDINLLLNNDITHLGAKLAIWIEQVPKIYEQIRYNTLHEELVALDLVEVADLSADWTASGSALMAAFELTWFSGIVSAAYTQYPSLSRFDSIHQEHLIEKFRSLDQKSIGNSQIKLAKLIWDNQPDKNQAGEMSIIRNELNKKRRHLPIRQLMNQAGRAVQAIKPVFMMSPMSIANFLPPGKLDFDVVIFDEASQVKAVDAIGAILRGRQSIVVGDTKQMPPTDFFGRDVDIDDDESVTGDIESILSLFRAKGAQERYLSWHYRSKHESLIAVSNDEFYDRKLVIFPSAGTMRNATGLVLHHIPAAIYDRGRTRTNLIEAKAVASAVMEHAKYRPELSLGVVAFSVAQRDLIQVEVEMLRRQHRDQEMFFSGTHSSEPFFIKNLENVQGDERDCIFISIGYGRNESGRIAKEFGPLNREGGERRLNVLISRAKMIMEVFSNFKGQELETDARTSHGVRALKHFLIYAETRQLNVSIETGKDVDSPFEFEVLTALKAHGYSLECQVGTAGYFIDLAVKDPEYPGRYILAIECDGASYHSSRSARDRDRLRQGVLESLGWNFHRIWSTDWFRDSSREIKRAVEAIERARANLKIPELSIKPDQLPTEVIQLFREKVDIEKNEIISNEYKKITLKKWESPEAMHEVSRDKLAALIFQIVEEETPVHESTITRRVMDAFEVTRAGKRIVDSMHAAIRYGENSGLFRREGDFVFSLGAKEVLVRNRSNFENSEKKIEFVAPIEIETAVLRCVKQAFTIERNDLVSDALEQLGFRRTTFAISNHINVILDALIERGELVTVDGKIAFNS
jgi:very-short-patch-repair endonuclease/DNA polymerase III delta prime subunit